MTAALVSLAIGASAAAREPPTPTPAVPGGAHPAFEHGTPGHQGSEGDFASRLDTASRRLLGAMYLLGPLGEGKPPDPDPRFRLDAFDCTTYVETVLALALAAPDNEAAARDWLDRIRYSDGDPTFSSRRHLIDAQWIPQLERQGLVLDVTRRIGGDAARSSTFRLDRAAWAKSDLARRSGLSWTDVPHDRQRLDYLPWDVIDRDDVRRALPRVAILDVVADSTTAAPTLVIHQALLFRTEDGVWVTRHASSTARRVVEEPLDVFLDRARARRRGTALGINVLSIVGVSE